jgi:hypothetical protein
VLLHLVGPALHVPCFTYDSSPPLSLPFCVQQVPAATCPCSGLHQTTLTRQVLLHP